MTARLHTGSKLVILLRKDRSVTHEWSEAAFTPGHMLLVTVNKIVASLLLDTKRYKSTVT